MIGLLSKKHRKKIVKVIDHRKAFKDVEKFLYGHNRFAKTHDIDKLIMLIIGLPIPLIKKLHRLLADHHFTLDDLSMSFTIKDDQIQFKNHSKVLEKLIDWECARFTKEEKPYTATAFYNMFFKNREGNDIDKNWFWNGQIERLLDMFDEKRSGLEEYMISIKKT